MPRFSLFLDDPILGTRSSAGHFIPWVRCTGSSGFWTKTNRSRFTANVLDDRSRTLEIVRYTGSTLKVRELEWKGWMIDFLEMQSLDEIGYKRSSRVDRFLWPMFEEFFSHLFHGECFCLNQDTLIGTSPKANEYATSAWDA